MRIYAAEKPTRITLVQWDGTNTQEVNDYLYAVSDPNAKIAELVDHGDGTGHIVSYSPDKPISTGEYVHATAAMWGGPAIDIFSPEEVNARYYTYPDYGQVVDTLTGGVL